MRTLAPLLLPLVLGAAGASAQMLPAMDLSQPKAKTTAPATSGHPAPAAEMPSMDLTGPTPVMRKGPPVPPVPNPTATPLVMPGLKLNGRSVSRERIDIVARLLR